MGMNLSKLQEIVKDREAWGPGATAEDGQAGWSSGKHLGEQGLHQPPDLGVCEPLHQVLPHTSGTPSAVYGVPQSRTLLKRLSSSSSSMDPYRPEQPTIKEVPGGVHAQCYL